MKSNFRLYFPLLLFNLCFFFYSPAQDSSKTKLVPQMVLQGFYQGVDMYVQNPTTNETKGFCVISCTVNGKAIDSINSSAFEIPLTKMGFKEGDSIKIEILHHNDCKPKTIYNPPPPKKPMDFTDFWVDSNYIFHWKTKEEIGKHTFTVETFVWNKWVKLGEVDSKGLFSEAEYVFQLAPHSGVNKVRVKVVTYITNPFITKALEFTSNVSPPEVWPLETKTVINFSTETMYEVYDKDGNLIMKGTGKSIDVSKLKKDVYYLNYDNQTSEFIKM